MIAPPASLSRRAAFPERSLDQLALTLEEMVGGYQVLLALLQEEKGLIVEADNEALIRCVARKEDCLSRISELEKTRQAAMEDIVPETPAISLKALIPSLPRERHERLRRSHERLEVLMASIQELNQLNGLLVQRVLGQISGLMRLFQQMTRAGKTYQPTGAMHPSPLQGRSIGLG